MATQFSHMSAKQENNTEQQMQLLFIYKIIQSPAGPVIIE